jgi:hypothetical protein
LSFKLLISCNLTLVKLNHQPRSLASFHLGPSFLICIWPLIDHQTFKFLQFRPCFSQFQLLKSRAFYDLVIGFDFFNQTPNWLSNCRFFTIKPLIWPIKLPINFSLPNFNFFQLKSNWLHKIDFSCNQILNKIN